MTDSPYKPPGRLGPAGSTPAVQRPGMVPVPPERPQQRKRGAVPGGAPLTRPQRPAGVEGDVGEDQAPTDRWSYAFAGSTAEGAVRGEGDEPGIVPPFRPAIELPESRPLTVLFYQDAQTPQIPTEPTNANFNSYYTFDAAEQNDEATGPGLGRFRLSETGTEQPSSGVIYLALPPDLGPLVFLDSNRSPKIKISYGGIDTERSWFIDEIVSWEKRTFGGVDYLVLTVNNLETSIDGADGPLDDNDPIRLELTGLRVPNAAVRARVRYRSGPSEQVFDCDWAGGFMVYAERLELQRVAYAPDTTIPFADAAVSIAATVQADAPRPGGSLSLTDIPVKVPSPDGQRWHAFPVQSMARRVNLILKYGDDEDAPGDAPLGQIFLAFVTKFDRSLCYIDAMSAREALFGAGMPIPAGASKLVVSNRSADDTMRIGLIWRLEL
jgi:hypothetical protein